VEGDAAVGAEDLLAAGWKPVRPSAFNQLIGPILHRRDGDAIRFCFRVDPKHDNSVDRPHGGMIMAFCDEALGLAAHMVRPRDRLLTVGFDCQFIGASSVGDVIEIEPHVTRATSSLIFMRGDCTIGDRVVASCSGIWKVFRPRAAAGGG